MDFVKLNDHRMSVSSLNLFDTSPKLYMEHVLNRKENVVKGYFSKGSAVDCLITEPEKFKDSFAIMTSERPSGMMGDLVVSLASYSKMEGADKIKFDDLFELAYQESQFKLSLAAVKAKFEAPNSDAKKYFKELTAAGAKTLLSQTEYDQVQSVVHVLKTDKYCAPFIEDYAHNALADVHDQFEILFECFGMESKAYLDRLIVDHASRTIHPLDIKTTGKPVTSFMGSYINYGYFRQAGFYMLAVNSFVNSNPALLGYKVQPFKFIVAEMDNINPPLVFEVPDKDMYAIQYLGIQLPNGKYLKSIKDLAEEVLWHREENEWDMPKSDIIALRNNGAIPLTLL